MITWEDPLFERKSRPSFPEDLQQMHESIKMPRFEDIRNQGKEIHKALKDTADHIKPNKTSLIWVDYQAYVNSLVIEGITHGIIKSMSFMSDQISIPYNKHHQLQPIFDMKVDLIDRQVIFDPSIEKNSKENGIKDILEGIVNDFISLAIQVPRLDTGNGDYLVEIKDQFVIYGAMQTFTDNFKEIEQATAEFIDQYKDKEFLWKETLAESF
jgi:dynein heavy chain